MRAAKRVHVQKQGFECEHDALSDVDSDNRAQRPMSQVGNIRRRNKQCIDSGYIDSDIDVDSDLCRRHDNINRSIPTANEDNRMMRRVRSKQHLESEDEDVIISGDGGRSNRTIRTSKAKGQVQRDAAEGTIRIWTSAMTTMIILRPVVMRIVRNELKAKFHALEWPKDVAESSTAILRMRMMHVAQVGRAVTTQFASRRPGWNGSLRN